MQQTPPRFAKPSPAPACDLCPSKVWSSSHGCLCTALINRICGLLSELGIVLPLKAATVRREAHQHLGNLPGWCNTVVGDMLSELTHLDERIKEYDQHIDQAAKQDTQARQLMQLGGVGPITASALVASVGKGHDFRGGRQFCAWLGVVPGQY